MMFGFSHARNIAGEIFKSTLILEYTQACNKFDLEVYFKDANFNKWECEAYVW